MYCWSSKIPPDILRIVQREENHYHAAENKIWKSPFAISNVKQNILFKKLKTILINYLKGPRHELSSKFYYFFVMSRMVNIGIFNASSKFEGHIELQESYTV